MESRTEPTNGQEQQITQPGGATQPAAAAQELEARDVSRLIEAGEPEPGAGMGELTALAESGAPALPEDAIREQQRWLRTIGWLIAEDGILGVQTRAAIKAFQRGFAFWKLAVDGHVGPKTREAMRYSLDRNGRCSPHFSFREFASVTRGSCVGDGWIKVARELVLGLEEYRVLIGNRPVAIRNGYRDPVKNRCVGGAPLSQHLFGNAVDLADPMARLEDVKRLQVFSGIGYIRSTREVLHCDVRHAGPSNTTGGTPTNPTVWDYA
jgi:zinc D-Ala-D-Ala carboxypeptidase